MTLRGDAAVVAVSQLTRALLVLHDELDDEHLLQNGAMEHLLLNRKFDLSSERMKEAQETRNNDVRNCNRSMCSASEGKRSGSAEYRLI